MKKVFRFIFLIVLLLTVIYLIGPKPESPKMENNLPQVNIGLADFEKYVQSKDDLYPLKLDNESKVFWYCDSVPSQTEYSLLYLHGFSACWYEGYPTHQQFAKQFGMNAYIPRLADHGIKTEDCLLNMTPDALYESAKEALSASRILGKKTIIMGTSTGGTLALKLAAEFPDLVHGLMLLSPNIAINNPAAFMLSGLGLANCPQSL